MSVLGEHDGNGIRYSMHLSAPKGGVAQMLRDPEGGWVSWEDYARLEHELKYWKIEAETDHARWLRTLEDYARLKAEFDKVDHQRRVNLVDAGSLFQKNARLKAEVERLTKAGDAMVKDLDCELGDYPSVDAWNAAKEGKDGR